MANITAVENKFFTIASETYENNLSSSISAGAVTVPVNSANEYADGDSVVLTVEAGTGNEASFVGTKASAPDRFVDCQWTEGNLGVGHASGVTITDYDSSTHHNLQTKGIRKFANDNGTLKTTAVQAALNISEAVPSDYTSLAQTATTVTALGNRSYSMLFPGVNYTDRLSPGMRLRTVRSAAAPNQTPLFDGVNDYFTKTTPAGMSQTDDITVMGWINPNSTSTAMGIIGKTATPGTDGWRVYIDAGSGNLVFNGAGRYILSYESIPRDRWTHFAITADFSANSVIMYLNGVAIPANVQAGVASWTNAGNLTVGAVGTNYFSGKIGQLGVFSSILTQATIRGYMSQGLSGSEPTLISGYSLSNSLNDLNITNANNLTASGGILATSANSPFGTQADGSISTTVDYGIIQKVTYSAPDTTVIVQVPDGCTIPTSGGVASVSYSQFKTPYQFPIAEHLWVIQCVGGVTSTATPAGSTWYYSNKTITVPIGAWHIKFQGAVTASSGAAGPKGIAVTLSTSASTETNAMFSLFDYTDAVAYVERHQTREGYIVITSAATPYYLLYRAENGGYTMVGLAGNYAANARGPIVIEIRNAYL